MPPTRVNFFDPKPEQQQIIGLALAFTDCNVPHLCRFDCPIVFLFCFAAEGKPLRIKIVTAGYSPPVTFTLAPPFYQAATPLTLSCQVENVDTTADFHYVWSSTCTGHCFVERALNANVSTHFLHSHDSGVHTCTVYDGLGCVGSANITVNVVGKSRAM